VAEMHNHIKPRQAQGEQDDRHMPHVQLGKPRLRAQRLGGEICRQAPGPLPQRAVEHHRNPGREVNAERDELATADALDAPPLEYVIRDSSGTVLDRWVESDE
jgi:hypothetical protein